MTKYEAERWDVGLTRKLTTAAQSDSRMIGPDVHSAARVSPSRHACASTSSAEPAPKIFFHADSTIAPRWFLITTPIPASPDDSVKAASTFTLSFPSSGGFHRYCVLAKPSTPAL